MAEAAHTSNQRAAPRSRPRALARHWRTMIIALAALLVVLGGAFFAVAWYYASALDDEALAVHNDPDRFRLVVRAVGPDTVTLEPAPGENLDDDWNRPGVQGLHWPDGYGQVGAILEDSPKRTVRHFTLLEGTLAPDTRVRLDTFAFPGDPGRAFALPFSDVVVDGPLGALPAWFVDAPGDRWAILVHGHGGATRRDMLRQVPIFHDAGLKLLVLSYRNDVGAPAERDGRYHFGATEWQDVDAAVAYALAHGATGLVLSGNSMGGAVVMSVLEHSSRLDRLEGVVLDSPLLDFEATVRWRARHRAPGVVVSAGLWVASWRFDLDYGDLDYLSRASALRRPILLFHGTADSTVQVATSDALARARPDLVTYFRTTAEHVGSWNADPAAYAAAVHAFLAQIAASPS
ncbi:MAG: prolyl oligopeptidase family serine peptidase [Dehalococcoidia bacterium]|nr:prolyl oligopeptidase family serine peptidase [Dehalococcoidia bacterium]